MVDADLDGLARTLVTVLRSQERDLLLFRDDALLDIVGEAVVVVEERAMEIIREEKRTRVRLS